MSQPKRPWPSLWLHETALHLPVPRKTDERALYHLRMCEFDVGSDHQRIIRLLTRRAEPSKFNLHPPGVLEISESARTHPGIAEECPWLEDLLRPFDRMNGGGR